MTMKKIKCTLLLLGFISYVTTVNAQSSLTIEASQLYASFKFTDTEGANLNSEYSGVFTGAYGLGYRFIADNGIMFNVGLGMRKAGATLDYDAMNYTWDLQYANGRLGFGYMLKKDKISPYLSVSGYYAYMLRGFQTINNENFNLKKSKLLNETDYGIFITPGVQFKLSDAVSSFVEFNYLMGLNNLEKDENQKATNFAYGVTLGLSFSISK